jgi:hypothetical protein
MNTQLCDSGIDPASLVRYIEEQIYTLPGISTHRQTFTILLTGSRAVGQHTSQSDVDLDVLCPPEAYAAVHQASLMAGIIKSRRGFFCPLAGADFHRYFGPEMACPHFSVTPLNVVERQFRDYEDVPLWIWTHARIITDPGGQFARIRDSFQGYPRDVLIRKIKHRCLLADYAGIEMFPLHHSRDDELLPAITALSTMIAELLRFFFLVEGKPYPYMERLMQSARTTALGREFGQHLQHVAELIAGKASPELPAWERLDRGLELLLCADRAPEAARLEEACYAAMKAAGVDPAWVEADFDNIHELLWGELGPVP